MCKERCSSGALQLSYVYCILAGAMYVVQLSCMRNSPERCLLVTDKRAVWIFIDLMHLQNLLP